MNYDVERLLAIRKELDEATEGITRELAQFEEDLHKLGIGVATWKKIGEGQPETFLGYRKFKGKWRLVLRFRENPQDEEEVIRPVVDCTRALRLHAYKHRYEILTALEETAQALAVRMRKALGGE